MEFTIGYIKLVFILFLFFRRPGEDRPWERGRLGQTSFAGQTLKEMLRNYFEELILL